MCPDWVPICRCHGNRRETVEVLSSILSNSSFGASLAVMSYAMALRALYNCPGL